MTDRENQEPIEAGLPASQRLVLLDGSHGHSSHIIVRFDVEGAKLEKRAKDSAARRIDSLQRIGFGRQTCVCGKCVL
jgi:hypothetical protein